MVTQENSNFLVKQSHIRFAYQRLSVTDTEHTERQRPLSGVHSIMMEKLAQVGEGVDCTCTPTPVHCIYCTIRHKVVVYAPAERAHKLPYFYRV